eukprot:1295896-Prymnesium_polylepis.1
MPAALGVRGCRRALSAPVPPRRNAIVARGFCATADALPLAHYVLEHRCERGKLSQKKTYKRKATPRGSPKLNEN